MSEAAKHESTASISGLRQPVTREKTRETVLKQSMRRIHKELEKLDKLVSEFEGLKKAHANSESSRAKLQTELSTDKAELIKILGLG